MNEGQLVIHGEVYLSLATVAQCYSVKLSWIREVYDTGLLGRGEQPNPKAKDIAIAASSLDRLSEVLRLHFYQDLSLDGIFVLLRCQDYQDLP